MRGRQKDDMIVSEQRAVCSRAIDLYILGGAIRIHKARGSRRGTQNLESESMRSPDRVQIRAESSSIPCSFTSEAWTESKGIELFLVNFGINSTIAYQLSRSVQSLLVSLGLAREEIVRSLRSRRSECCLRAGWPNHCSDEKPKGM